MKMEQKDINHKIDYVRKQMEAELDGRRKND